MSLPWLAVALACAAAPPPPGGPADAFAMLHASQVQFAADGEPVVTVGLMDGQDRVVLSAPGGLRVGLGESHVTIPAGHPLELSVKDARPGETRWRVVLDGVAGGDLAAIREARQRWGDRGFSLEVREVGGIVGYPGRLLDNRRAMVMEAGSHATRDEAEARAAEVAERWLLAEPPTVVSEPVRRASGVVVARDRRSGVTLQQAGLLEVRTADGGPVEVQRVEHHRGYANHGFEDRAYHGAIVVAVDPDGRLAVVNRVPAEQLLRGLVPSEIFPSAPAAALDAQAITARGELLAKLGTRHLADPYLVCAHQHCQVYSGTSREAASTDAAVRRTRGLMLFDGADRLVDSVYSASCGGHTESNEHVWEGLPKAPLRGRADAHDRRDTPWPADRAPTEDEVRAFLVDPPRAWCGVTSLGRRAFRWERAFPDAELDTLVNAHHAVGHVKAIEVLDRGVSGRVKAVRFRGTEGAVVVGRELAVRRLLGNLRSGLFVVERAPGRWTFVGGGYGHGVGMCQYGAIGMAEQGRTAQEILGHYYQGAAVQQVY